MRKALLPSTIFLLVLFVIILVSGFVFVKTYADKAQQYLNQLLRETPESLILKEAIKCSYYRCFDGCEKVKNIRWEFLENQKCPDGKDCKDKCPCDEVDLNKDGKVCDDESKLSPISVNLLELEQIFKNKMIDELKESKVKPSFVSESGDNCKDWGYLGLINVDKAKIVPNAKVDDDVCKFLKSQIRIGNCFEQVVMYSGPYFIWTTDVSLGGNTVVCGEKPEVTLDCSDLGGTCEIEVCPTGKTEIKAYCPQGRDVTKVCCKPS